MNRLKSTLQLAISTGLLFTAGAVMAGQVVSQHTYKPTVRTTIITERVCGHRGCVNIHKKIHNRPNGTQKVVTERCQHGFCNRHVMIRIK
jgi:hypothetical protein